MKKFLAILLVAMMLLATASVAFAATETFTITAPAASAIPHTYEIYQIFTGDLSNGKLSNVLYGADTATGNTVGAAVPDSVVSSLTAVSSGTTTEKLAAITALVNIDGTPAYTIDNDSTNNEGENAVLGSVSVPAGYYLIKDKDATLNGQDDAYTTYIVKVANDITIAPKSVKPSVDKEVHDEAGDAEGNAADGWGETADHELFENFNFKLVATLPADTDYDAYTTYSVAFKDTMSAGVTFVEIVSVKVDGIDATGKYTHTVSGQNLDVVIADVKAITGVDLTNDTEIEVIYTAYLNENAITYDANVTTTADNKNTVYLEYSNNPAASGTGHTRTGKTPDDSVWVFAYEVDVTKVAPNEETTDNATDTIALAGAGFTLYTDSACTTAVNLVKVNGEYLVNKDNKTITGATAVTNNEIVTDSTGKFTIRGLDNGTYYLKETTTPAGYNTCAVQTVIVSATHVETVTADDAKAEAGKMELANTSTLEMQIVNNSGAVLPETGGIGTTLFYLFGGLMTAGSALVLIVRRRADAEEE